jgi:intein/homing endonuclease
LAYDDQTGDVALKEVAQTFKNETYELTTVRTDDGQEIISTPGHKYYTLDREWISANELRAGDRLLNVNGDVVIVEWVQHEIFENPIEIYNFEVKDYHTYYVAENINAPVQEFVLVHNRDCSKLSPDQQALIELAKEKEKGLPRDQANILVDWAEEYGIKTHRPDKHLTRSGYWSDVEHIRIFKYHIPIIGG